MAAQPNAAEDSSEVWRSSAPNSIASFSEALGDSYRRSRRDSDGGPLHDEPSFSEQQVDGGGGLSMYIYAGIDVQLGILGEPLHTHVYDALQDSERSERGEASARAPPGLARRYCIRGPPAKVAMLAKLLHGRTPGRVDAKAASRMSAVQRRYSEASGAGGDAQLVSGPFSPLHPVNLPARSRRATGVPLTAQYFAFCYPADGMEAVLEALNLTDQPWAFLLLLGGFVYFDRQMRCCGVNAIGLAGSPLTLEFGGPYALRPAVLDALEAQRRLQEVTLDALEAQGFVSFCWLHPHERPGGEDVHRTQRLAYGGFVYLSLIHI